MEGHREQGARGTVLQELLCGYPHLQEPIFPSEESHRLNPKSLPLPRGPWRDTVFSEFDFWKQPEVIWSKVGD